MVEEDIVERFKEVIRLMKRQRLTLLRLYNKEIRKCKGCKYESTLSRTGIACYMFRDTRICKTRR